ncbi:type IV pilin [Halomicroarcula sp. GCM10025709]|uniref:type IV pilin n=1 Tax=Haloarcula TaxID=2237 RepID=UPI0024C2F67C|nr:type IV pilin [Halomicroarcula sp. YJ-61-S]
MTRRPSADRGGITAERLAVWTLAVLAAAGLAVLAVGPGADLRTSAPEITVETAFDADAGAVTLTHAGGDRLTGTNTRTLSVVVTDADRNASTTVVWADETGLPVEQGDSFTVDDPRVDSDGDGDYLDGDASVGFHLEAGDRVTVVWTGRLLGAPEERSVAIAEATLTADGG